MTARATVDANRTPVNFNKYQWRDAFRSVMRSGSGLSHRHAALVMTLVCTMGTASRDCHVPIVWRTVGELATDADMSKRTLRTHRNALIDAGFIHEIASGRGHRQKILVLSLPSWTKETALRIALDSLTTYADRTGNHLGWVNDALRHAIACIETAATATFHGERVGESSPESLEPPPPQNDPVTPFIHRNTTRSHGSRGFIGANPRGDHEPTTDEHDGRQGEDKGTSPDVIDFNVQRERIQTIQTLFENVGRQLDAGAALGLSRAYSHPAATPDALLATLTPKVLRLVADGYGVGQIVAFLYEDATDWAPPTPPKPSTDRQTDAPKTPDGRLKDTSSTPDEHDDFLRRFDELLSIHGTKPGGSDRIDAALADEFGADHPLLTR